MVLNPKLYEALQKKFGDVKISNEGSKYIGKKTLKNLRGKTIYEIEDISRGEQYCVTCPACGGKHKLTISYICGTIPPPFTEKVWHKIHCFRCNFGKKHGNAKALKEVLGGYVKLAENVKIAINEKAIVESKPLESYGTLGELDDDTAAGIYVRGRGFNLEEVRAMYNLKRIAAPPIERSFLRDYLFIPMYAEGKLISWQARAVFPRQEPRWYLASGGKKPIFSLDLAAQTSCVVIQEGVFDAIACGSSGVAIMGKFLTGYQAKLISSVKKPIIVCLDPDARDDAKKLYYHLKQTHHKLVTLFQYPDNWPTEYNIDKDKTIPKDAASVGKAVMLPLLKRHFKEHYKERV